MKSLIVTLTMETVFAILFLVSPPVMAQTFVKSTLPINASPVIQRTTAYGVVNESVLLLGKFTAPSLTLDDIVSVDSSGAVNCIHPNNDGTFNSPVISNTGIALPLMAIQKETLDPTQTDSIVLSNGLQVFQLTLSNCGVTNSVELTLPGAIPLPGVIAISGVIPNLLGNDSGILFTTLTTTYSYDISSDLISIQNFPTPPPLPGDPPFTLTSVGAEFVQGGDFSLGGPTPYPFVLVQTPPNTGLGQEASDYEFGNLNGGLNLTEMRNNVSGAQFLDFVFTSSGIVSLSFTNCPTCNEAEIFLDRFTLGTLGPNTLPITEFDIPGVPVGVGAVVGNFLGNGFDLVVATNTESPLNDNIFLAKYLPGPFAQWQVYADSLNAGGVISALNHGPLIDADDIAVIVGPNVVIFSSTGATVNPPSPPLPTLTLTPPSQTIQAGQSATFQITESGFTSPPSMTASCSIPKATCAISGTTLTVTTTASSTMARTMPPKPIAIVAGFSALCMAIVCFVRNKRRWVRTGLLAGGLVLLGACGGGTSPATKPGAPVPVTTSGTAAGVYNIQVTSGTVSAIAQLTIQ